MRTSNLGRGLGTVLLAASLVLGGCAGPELLAEEPADAAQIHEYAFAVLTVGPLADSLDQAAVAAASTGHRAHIESLGAEGALLLAGPFGEPRAEASWQGLYVFDLADVEQAYARAGADPAVVAGLFDVVIVPWRSKVSLRPMRDKLQQEKAAGAPFVPAAYVLAIGEPSEQARAALHGLGADELVLCAGELGAEREGQYLLLLAAETVEDAEQWLGLVDPATHWELSSFWATALLGELAGGTSPGV